MSNNEGCPTFSRNVILLYMCVFFVFQLKYRSWTINNPDCTLFSSLLSGAGPVIGQILDDVIPVLTHCLHPDGDPEMRLQ